MHKYNCPLKQKTWWLKDPSGGKDTFQHFKCWPSSLKRNVHNQSHIYILFIYFDSSLCVSMCSHYVCACASVQPIGYFQEVVAILGFFYNQISESETCRTGHRFLWTHSRTHSSTHTQTHPAISTQTSTNCNCCAKRRKSHCNLHLLATC